jgi:hypothetical protein
MSYYSHASGHLEVLSVTATDAYAQCVIDRTRHGASLLERLITALDCTSLLDQLKHSDRAIDHCAQSHFSAR